MAFTHQYEPSSWLRAWRAGIGLSHDEESRFCLLDEMSDQKVSWLFQKNFTGRGARDFEVVDNLITDVARIWKFLMSEKRRIESDAESRLEPSVSKAYLFMTFLLSRRLVADAEFPFTEGPGSDTDSDESEDSVDQLSTKLRGMKLVKNGKLEDMPGRRSDKGTQGPAARSKRQKKVHFGDAPAHDEGEEIGKKGTVATSNIQNEEEKKPSRSRKVAGRSPEKAKTTNVPSRRNEREEDSGDVVRKKSRRTNEEKERDSDKDLEACRKKAEPKPDEGVKRTKSNIKEKESSAGKALRKGSHSKH